MLTCTAAIAGTLQEPHLRLVRLHGLVDCFSGRAVIQDLFSFRCHDLDAMNRRPDFSPLFDRPCV